MLKPKKMPRATKAQLRNEIERLRHVGQQFSNMAYNLSQGSQVKAIDQDVKGKFKELYKEWDNIARSEKRS
jgi:hypothetical protein